MSFLINNKLTKKTNKQIIVPTLGNEKSYVREYRDQSKKKPNKQN